MTNGLILLKKNVVQNGRHLRILVYFFENIKNVKLKCKST